MSKIPSYSKVYTFGHKDVITILNDPVVIQEKIDGSSFSAEVGCFSDDPTIISLRCRSKENVIDINNPDKMFASAVNTFKTLAERGMLTPGLIYRGEVVSNVRHNVLTYNRVPLGNVILFDVWEQESDTYMTPDQLKDIAASLNLESVPLLYQGSTTAMDHLKSFLDGDSILGGKKEGIVIKNYSKRTPDGKLMVAKIVSDSFKEVHGSKRPKASQPDPIQTLIERYRNESRWEKSIQHLRDAGKLDRSLKDVGPLIKEIQRDVLDECEEEMKDLLFEVYWPKIRLGIINGFPDFYKEKLARSVFEGE